MNRKKPYLDTQGKKLEDQLEDQWNSLMDTLNEPYLDTLGEKQKLEDKLENQIS